MHEANECKPLEDLNMSIAFVEYMNAVRNFVELIHYEPILCNAAS